MPPRMTNRPVYRESPVYRDSIARSQSNDDVYSLIRNPRASSVKKPAPVDTISSDSLQARLERDALAKLKANNSQFPNDKLVVIARAGKFIFVALTLPVYIIVFSFPKWMLLELAPFLFKFSLKGLGKLAKPLSKLYRYATKLTEALSLGNRYDWVKTKAVAYLSWINRVGSSVFVHLKHQVIFLMEKLYAPLSTLGNWSLEKMAVLQTGLKSTGEWFLNKISKAVFLKESLDRMFQKIKQFQWSGFINRLPNIEDALHWIPSLGRSINMRISKALEIGKNLFKLPLKFPRGFFIRVAQPIGSFYQNIKQIFKNKKFKSEKFLFAANEIGQAIKQAATAVSHVMIAFVNPLMQFTKEIIGKRGKLLFKIGSYLNQGRNKRSFFKQGLSVIKNLLKGGGELITWTIKHQTFRLWQWLKRFSEQARFLLKDLFAKIWKGSKLFYIKFREVGAKIVLSCRVLLAWMTVLSKFGWQLMREINKEIFDRMRAHLRG